MAWLAPILSVVGQVAGVVMPILSATGVTGGKKSSGNSTTSAASAQATKDKEAQAAEEKKRQAILFGKAGGKSSTILTSGRGLTGTSTVDTGLKTKLGG